MKNLVYIAFLIVIILLAVFYKKNTKEGFTFNQCRNLGYSKEFCVQSPTGFIGPSGCLCPDGTIGKILPGFRGKCVCSYPNIFF